MRRSSGIAFVAREIAAMAGASVEEGKISNKRARRERKGKWKGRKGHGDGR